MKPGFLPVVISLAALAAMLELSIESSPGRPQQRQPPHGFVTRTVSSSVTTGPTPHGIKTMRQLRQAGIRTLISVDGARPDVESAAAVGMSYVHLPAGYDGVSPNVLAGLTRVMRERDLPVYVHCHHGKHRGPAAAAVCAMIAGELMTDQAISFLETAGTSHDYSGLWKSVERFEPLPDDAPLPELYSVADVEPLVETMVRIDAGIDALQQLVEGDEDRPVELPAARAADSRTAAHVLHQELREAARLLSSGHPDEFVELMKRSVRQAKRIAVEVEAQPLATPPTLAKLRQTCTECHDRYRN